MATTTSFEGFSKTRYDYLSADQKNLEALPMQGGNFLFAQRVGGKPEIVYAAETDCLRKAVVKNPLWDRARTRHNAVFIFFHVNDTPARRRLELHDLIRRYSPPMNAVAQMEEDDD